MPLPPFLFEYLLSGFFATVAMTLAVFLLRGALGVHLDIPVMLGSMILPATATYWHRRIGMATHLLLGSVLGMIFGLFVYYKFIFHDASAYNSIAFALLSWLLMMAILMPISGRGFFGFKYHERIWVSSLIGHVVWGASFTFFLYILFYLPEGIVP